MSFKNIPIIKRIIPSIRKNLRLILNKEIFWTKINDIFFLLDIRQKQDREFYFKQKYEEDNFNFLDNNAFFNNSFIFVDVGCNIGIYTLIISKKFTNCNKVIAIEPILSTFKRLVSNIKVNKIENLTTALNIALSNEDGKSKMRSISKNNQVQLSKFEIDKEGDIEVDTKRFDNLFNFINENIFIKCDAEGHEYKIIEGMKNTLVKNNCFLQIEIFEKNYNVMKKLLNDLGYTRLASSKEKDTYFFVKLI